MYVISFSNPKGGTGKTTTALLLAEEFATAGKKVVIVDNDPAQNIVQWANERATAGKKHAFDIQAKSDPDTYDDLLGKFDSEGYDFAIVDTEGVKDLMASIVAMSSDLVVIPMQASPMDARNAASQLSVVTLARRHTGRTIPYRFVFTRTNAAIETKLFKSILADMENLPVMNSKIVERAAYKHMHEDGCLLRELNLENVSGIEKAIQNSVEFSQEIIEVLKGS